jgi:hypothetical protein
MSRLSSTSQCESRVHVYDEGDADFHRVLEALFSEPVFLSQCTGANGAVNYQYAKTYMRHRAEVVAFVPRQKCAAKRGTCGFGLGFAKTEVFDGEQVDIFYIDLVCSQSHKGGAILRALEEYAKDNDYQVVALRAAVPQLVKYYQRKGYVKAANACVPPSRASRLILRGLNRFSSGVAGAREGVFTDGQHVVSSVDDAWTKARLPRPEGVVDLPPGWRFEAGYHGFWMSKCL